MKNALVYTFLRLFMFSYRGQTPYFWEALRPDFSILKKVLQLGIPITLQDLLVSISFLVLLGIVNSLGVIVSAGVGVAEKLCAFIMLVSSAYMQAMSAFTAQNIGAGKPERAEKALLHGGTDPPLSDLLHQGAETPEVVH